jgi:hypothetical protein
LEIYVYIIEVEKLNIILTLTGRMKEAYDGLDAIPQGKTSLAVRR